MRIVIDLQGAQSTGSRNRGIGRYTSALTKAIVRNSSTHEIIVALNGLFPDTIEPIRADLQGLLPQGNIRVWYAPGPVSSYNVENVWRRRSAELIREAFLASFKPDVVLVSSLFEGLGDDAVTSIGTLCKDIPTAVILYDLIPYIYRAPYLENPVVEAWYERKLDHFRRADILLAISESSRQESMRYLGFEEKNSVNISTAVEHQFRPVLVGSEYEAKVRQRYSLRRPYVMYTGGIDHRKNIEGLIRAYAELPKALRVEHQLAVVCAIQPKDKDRLDELARKQGLSKDDLILTGFVPDEDLLALYCLCKVFVFPSCHEGFGLPALEAMSCGKAVIGSNTSSIPEVIGREDALFDPRSDKDIAAKLEEVLTNDAFRIQLESHGLEQAKKFSWDKSAVRAISAMEQLLATRQPEFAITLPYRRPKLAYVSPLPPERSGISDYSAELLPELSRHYNIDVIVAQSSVSDSWIRANCQIREVEWFRTHAGCYDRVIYHFGNSHFHQHMFRLLEEIPGVVVLHDFFLSGILAQMELRGATPNGWTNELYEAHGYNAVRARFHYAADAIMKYPCNLSVLRDALGVIVHSENSRRLGKYWYGATESAPWAVIPHLRTPVWGCDRAEARRQLRIKNDDFVVCSFGILGPHKLNNRLLKAWLSSDLARERNCLLVFVGENHGAEYGQELLASIRRSGARKRVRITGWADSVIFRNYLMAADIGVQLRTFSRGETSGTVLDCMNYGLATIVNANGSMADLPDDAVWKIADEFGDDQLIEALETLWRDEPRREQLGRRARDIILVEHAPRMCADQYRIAIEKIYRVAATGIHSLTNAMACVEPTPPSRDNLLTMAEAVAQSIPAPLASVQLLVDVSELVQRDSKSGIQRVVRSILCEWLTAPPPGVRIEPVYAALDHGYRYARRFALDFLNCPNVLADDPIEYRAGDIFLGLDLQTEVVFAHREFYQQMRRHGVRVQFVVYDLLCISMPQYFFDGDAERQGQWLEVVTESDAAICISKAVADEVRTWDERCGQKDRLRPLKISWFYLGAEIVRSALGERKAGGGNTVPESLRKKTSFLMVGTIEPRKGYAQALSAFEQLWAHGVEANLVIVGKEGWMVGALIDRIRNHPERGNRLLWLGQISDEDLEQIYTASTCLIAASEGEGFGLPLIEAAQHKLPIIARDIPVFREVAGDQAFYFRGLEPVALADAVKQWLTLHGAGVAPKSGDMPYLTWAESAQQLVERVMNVK